MAFRRINEALSSAFYKQPRGLVKVRSSATTITVAVWLSVFTDLFLYALIVPIAPQALVSRMGATSDNVQHWISVSLAVYSVGLLSGSPFAGYVSDRLNNRRMVLLWGLVVLLAATIVITFSHSISQFAAGRFVQGFAGSFVWTVGLAILNDSIPPERFGKSLGVVSTGLGLGSVFGVILGGILYKTGGYYSVFGIGFGVIGLDFCSRFFMLEKKDRIAYEEYWAERQDSVREEPISTNDEIDMIALDGDGHWTGDRGTSKGVDETTEAVVADGAPTRKEIKIPAFLYLLKFPRMIAALLATVTQGWCLSSADALVPLYTEQTFGVDSLGAGLIFFCIAVPPLIMGPLCGAWLDRRGPRLPATLGYLGMCCFFTLLRIATKDRGLVVFCVIFTFVGVFLSLTITSAMAEINNIVGGIEKKDPGIFGAGGAMAQAYGLYNVAFSLGTLLGPLQSGATNTEHGWAAATMSLGILCGLTAIPTVIYHNGLPFSRFSTFWNKFDGFSSKSFARFTVSR